MKNIFLKSVLLLIIASLFFSCSEKKSNKLDKVSQIIGKWQSNDGVMNIGEQYHQKDDSTISGRTFMLRGSDTIPLENIEIHSRKGKIFYIPTILGQNQKEPIPFELKKDSANHLFFENKQHDFPQRVVYHFVTKDSIYAFIDGTSSGVYMKNDFVYKRVK